MSARASIRVWFRNCAVEQLLVRQRTTASNAICGHLVELSDLAQGPQWHGELLPVVVNANDDRIPVARFCFEALARQYVTMTAEVGAVDKRIHAWHRSCEDSRRLEEIPGINPIVGTALPLFSNPRCKGLGADSGEKHEPVSDIDIGAMDSLTQIGRLSRITACTMR